MANLSDKMEVVLSRLSTLLALVLEVSAVTMKLTAKKIKINTMYGGGKAFVNCLVLTLRQ